MSEKGTGALTEKQKEEIVENKKVFPQLRQQIGQGKHFLENMNIIAVDGQTYQITIRALGEGEIMEEMEKADMNWIEITKPEKLNANLKAQRGIVARAIVSADEVWTPEIVGTTFRFGEVSKVAMRVLQISGIYEPKPSKMKKFRAKQDTEGS